MVGYPAEIGVIDRFPLLTGGVCMINVVLTKFLHDLGVYQPISLSPPLLGTNLTAEGGQAKFTVFL